MQKHISFAESESEVPKGTVQGEAKAEIELGCENGLRSPFDKRPVRDSVGADVDA